MLMNKIHKAHLLSAYNYARLSTARRLKVGCLIVKNNRIISIGYNGTAPGADNNCEHEVINDATGHIELRTKAEVIHAEANAIAKLAQSTESSACSDAYITHAPCLDCSKLLLVAGIQRVFYSEAYRDHAGIDYLQANNIEVQQLTDVDL